METTGIRFTDGDGRAGVRDARATCRAICQHRDRNSADNIPPRYDGAGRVVETRRRKKVAADPPVVGDGWGKPLIVDRGAGTGGKRLPHVHARTYARQVTRAEEGAVAGTVRINNIQTTNA